ncbi:MAG: LysM peptidoglycan-binding domain-containing protein [Oliverpabstia sp.]|nr:LysM peptidoglycan-binding domain-containing protein [Lachnospiraceae bacterium]MDY5026237.1 LysM peptidoglycan-binding domain-containing protein [Oliverpabstia sp.]
MIEIIYKEDQKQAEGNEKFFRIPNNIRQIGEIKGQQKIYIEDYAYTFLKKISRIPEEGGKVAILLGQYHWAEGNAYLFIKSALQIRNMEVSPEHIVFSDKVWGQVYEDSRKYFPQQEIVGWFISLPGFNMQINEVLLKTHLNHFAGNDKVLFAAEPGEWEEAFFVYENNQLNRQPGYYIYYEKNEPMQAYMIEMSQNKSIEETEKVPDRAVMDFRKAVKQNYEKKDISKNRKTNKMTDRETEKTVIGKENQKNSRMVWTLGGCTVAAALALGITFFNSYQNMSETLGILETGQEAEQQEEIAKEASAQAAETNDEPLISMQDMNPQKITNEENNTEDTQIETETETDTDTTGGQDVSQENAESDAADQNLVGENEQAEMTGQSSSETDASAAMMTEGQTAGGDEYIIQKGDTLTSISKKYYGTIAKVEEICRLNGISPEDIIYAGQKLVLPE